jgi:SAM-dependent methyltransferase
VKETLIGGNSRHIQNIRKIMKKLLEPFGMVDYSIYLYESHYQYLKKLSFWRYKENFLFYWYGGAPDGYPVPNMFLMWLVFASIRKIRFIETGENQFNKLLLPMLDEKGIDLYDSKCLMDFGCGCGRITRHLHILKNTDIWGVDYNSRLIKWCNKYLPVGTYQTNSLEPPLPFPNNKFDFIIARSVFTHLNANLQLVWLSELYRVLKPGGYFFFTTMGGHYEDLFSEKERKKYHNGELVVVHGTYSGKNRCYVWQPPEYTYKVWPQHGFEIINYKAGGIIEDAPQDSYLSRKF